MTESSAFTLNGQPVTLETDPDRSLLWVLRTDLERTGTKYGCGEGICGSCTVVVDGRAVRACQTTLAFVRGKQVTTIPKCRFDAQIAGATYVAEPVVRSGNLLCARGKKDISPWMKMFTDMIREYLAAQS